MSLLDTSTTYKTIKNNVELLSMA